MQGDREKSDTREKVFGIGLPKTGLTSLLMLAMALGYNAMGRKQLLSKLFYKRRFGRILAIYDQHDFLIDHPTCLMYKLAFERYGRDAKYILTLRRDPDTWYESLLRHQRYAHPVKNKHHKWFGRFYPHGFKEEHIDYYEDHRKEVLRFFEEQGASDRLLVLCLEEPGAFKKLIDFLGVETEITEFPQENVSAEREQDFSNRLRRNYNDFIQPLYARYMPRLRPATPRQAIPPEPGVKLR